MRGNEKAGLPGPALSESAAAKLPGLAVDSTGSGDLFAPLTDAALSTALRDYDIAKANENGDAYWRSCLDAAVDHLAASNREWSADDIFELGVPAPDHPNRTGAALYAAVRAGVVVPTGYTLSRRPSRHRGVQRLYRGGAAR